MATWSAIELEVLQKALDAYPKGIGGNEYGTTVPEYSAPRPFPKNALALN